MHGSKLLDYRPDSALRIAGLLGRRPLIGADATDVAMALCVSGSRDLSSRLLRHQRTRAHICLTDEYYVSNMFYKLTAVYILIAFMPRNNRS